MRDSSVSCSVRGVTSLLSFSVTTDPALVSLQRTEVSHSSQDSEILWVPFDIKATKLTRLKASYEEEEEDSRDIYNYLGENFYKTSHNRRESKRSFNTDLFQPVTMALVSQSPSSHSAFNISLFLLTFLIKL